MSAEFSPGLNKKIKEVISRYPHKSAALLPVLHLVQREVGPITPEEERRVANLLEIKPIKVREVVTFYTMFVRRPVGKYHIQVCSNLSCSLLDSEKIISHLEDKLGIKVGETTEDGRFTLTTVECLGACEQAPCMMINFETYGDLSKKRVDEILGGLE